MHKVLPGEPITADLFNALVERVASLGQLSAGGSLRLQRSSLGASLAVDAPGLDLVEFDEDCAAGQVDRQVRVFGRDWSASGAAPDQWKDSGARLGLTMDPQSSLYLAGERHLALFHAGAGQRIPIPGAQFHLAKASSPIVPESSGSVLVYRLSAGSHVSAGQTITAYDWAGYGIAPSPSPCLVWQHLQSKRWYAINLCGASWARAQAAWIENGGNPIVSCRMVGYWGDTTTYGSAFYVQLPRMNFSGATTHTSRDPNVQSGDWIRFTRDSWNPVDQPGLVCVSPYLDDKIGTIKLWYKTSAAAALPGGWAICDGTGGTPDLRGKFVRGVPSGGTLGTAGGAATHTHAAHPAHAHNVEQTGGVQLTPVGTMVDGSAGSTQYVFPNGNSVFTDTEAAVSHDVVNHEPPYHDIYYVMRVS